MPRATAPANNCRRDAPPQQAQPVWPRRPIRFMWLSSPGLPAAIQLSRFVARNRPDVCLSGKVLVWCWPILLQKSAARFVHISQGRGSARRKNAWGTTQSTGHSTSGFRIRVTIALNSTFSSQRVSTQFSSSFIFRLLQQNRPQAASRAANKSSGDLSQDQIKAGPVPMQPGPRYALQTDAGERGCDDAHSS